ncbi:hypothetical protein FA15DRAFT_668513 [Coprinopsis marcescibilis]|uniref:Uncharacterized protein n=1 Tax=Coprinopsis marcescibilis TaxID=230819 RepID=A0A5C3KYS3_COPMA|nr:hypothetical protein FA15DRAFT_668513 [Coprinopsis marcescibilis]
MSVHTKADTVSEFLPFFSHNEPLPDNLVRKCASHRKPIIDEISGLDKLIKPLLEELSQLQSRKEVLVTERIKYDTLLFPTRHFPNELVALLLRYSLDELLDSKGRKHFAVLRAVCKQWRDVAFTTLELWRSLSLTIVSDLQPSSSDQDLWHKTVDWYQRAGVNKPFSLRLTGEAPAGIREADMESFMESFFEALNHDYTFTPFLKATLKNVGDFQFFSCHCPRHFFQSHLHKMANLERLTLAATRNLQTVIVDEDDIIYLEFEFIVASLERSLPKLLVLHLGGWSIDSFCIGPKGFYHSGLKTLHLSYCDFKSGNNYFDYFAEVITELPQLRELILEQIQSFSFGNSSPRTYQHTGLKSLVVSGITTIWAISNLILPSLVYLRISHEVHPPRDEQEDGGKQEDEEELGPEDITTISRLFETATLHTLSLNEELLSFCTSAGSEPENILSRAPSIRHLEVPDCTALERINIDTALKTNGLAALESVICRNACTPEEFVRIHGPVVDWMSRQQGQFAGRTSDRLKIYQRFVDEDTRLVGDVEAEYLKALDALRNVGVDVITGQWSAIPRPSFPHHDDCPFESLD